jgi:hypothetical protein
MRNYYKRALSSEIMPSPIAHSRLLAVEERDAKTFLARYEIVNDEDGTTHEFELIVNRSVSASDPCWQQLGEQFKVFYDRAEDLLTYRDALKKEIIQEIYARTKKAPPKPAPAAKPSPEQNQ